MHSRDYLVIRMDVLRLAVAVAEIAKQRPRSEIINRDIRAGIKLLSKSRNLEQMEFAAEHFRKIFKTLYEIDIDIKGHPDLYEPH